MPIYEYLCNSCGVKKEHIQKMSDTPIKNCPDCGNENYNKLISAAGFQLKGSGWYVTDFKDKPSQPATKTNPEAQSKPANNQTHITEKKSAKETTSSSKPDKKAGSEPTSATTN